MKHFIRPCIHRLRTPVNNPLWKLGGWGNAYVIVDITHPWYRLDWEELTKKTNLDISLSTPIERSQTMLGNSFYKYLTEEDIDKWLIGLDTMHANMSLETHPEEKVQELCLELLKKCYEALE